MPLLRDDTCQRRGMCLVWTIKECGMFTVMFQCASLWIKFGSTGSWSVKCEYSQSFWVKFTATMQSQTLGLRYNYIYVPWTTDGASNIGLASLRCVFCCLQFWLFFIGAMRTLANKSARTDTVVLRALCVVVLTYLTLKNQPLQRGLINLDHVWSDCLGLPILSLQPLARQGCDILMQQIGLVGHTNFHSAGGVHSWAF